MHTFRRMDFAQVVRVTSPKERRGGSLRLPLELTQPCSPPFFPLDTMHRMKLVASFLPQNTKAAHWPCAQDPRFANFDTPSHHLPPTPPTLQKAVHCSVAAASEEITFAWLDCQDPQLRHRALQNGGGGTRRRPRLRPRPRPVWLQQLGET